MRWTDIEDIASALEEKYSEKDNITVRFTDLHKWILGLEGFTGLPEKSNERILEAIQAAWIEERK